MNFIYLIIFSIIFAFNNFVAYAYNEEDVQYFLLNSECNQCDLSNYNFEGKYLDQAIISESNLSGSNFNNVKMANSRILSSDFTNTTFIHADMNTTLIEDSNFTNADLSQINLVSSTIINSIFIKTNLDLAKMYGITAKLTIFDEANITNVNIQKSILSTSSFFKTNFTECIVNKKAFNALPIHLQKIVEHACISENNRMLSEFTYANNVSQVKLIELGVNIQNFPNDVYKEMFKISKEVVAETANEGDINKRIYNSWSKFKKEAKERGSFAEQGYMNRRG